MCETAPLAFWCGRDWNSTVIWEELTLHFLIFLQEQGVCLGVSRFLVISVKKFSRLYLSRCACVNCVNLNVFVLLLELLWPELPVSLLHPVVIRVYGKTVSLKGCPPFICTTSFHPFSQFFCGGHLRFIREAINPLHTMSNHWLAFHLTFPFVWRKWSREDVALHYSLVSSSRAVLGSQKHGAESTQHFHLPLLSKQAQPSLA